MGLLDTEGCIRSCIDPKRTRYGKMITISEWSLITKFHMNPNLYWSDGIDSFAPTKIND